MQQAVINCPSTPSNMPSTSTSNILKPNITQMRQAQEHRRLFSFGGRNVLCSNKKSKKGKERKPTCILKFVALSEMATSKPPSKVCEKTALLNGGLGEASIQFFLDMSRLECHDKILERFPKLKETGYEMLLFQRGDDSGFVNIGGPRTARWLKDAAGSAKIYLCPLQKDVDMDLMDSDDESQVRKRHIKCHENIFKHFLLNKRCKIFLYLRKKMKHDCLE